MEIIMPQQMLTYSNLLCIWRPTQTDPKKSWQR